ncbi:hypothetical protein KW801_00780 [Candidatus Saccharibacteria bacterium]|nr:hypothetical protein [Candidatus Saccharibacteria bacterium]
MDKYVLLFLLNLPFVIFGLLKAVMVYRTKNVDLLTFILRLSFWILILLVLVFAHGIYNYLYDHGLTDSTPLSLPDVVLATGVMLVFSLCVRLYAKVDALDKRISDLHEKLSVYVSENPKP